ncbi:hypothetical protein WJ69_34375 [Burkholderia ubonensis]|nr:hypothetical protein WJ69_34375 [Burkholderia ubonensis]
MIAVFFDIRERRIPNWLIASTLITSLVVQIHFDSGWMWLAGMLIGFAMFIPGYAARQMGAGDVKLMAAVGSIFGLGAFKVGLVAYAMGGIYALAWMAMQRDGRVWWKYVTFRLRTAVVMSMTMSGNPLTDEALSRARPRTAPMPYSVPIALAGMFGLWAF